MFGGHKKSLLTWRCPACYKAGAFAGFISLKKTCEVCGFAYHRAEVGDGAVFIAMTAGCLLLAMVAGLVEILYQPSYLLHAMIWPIVLAVGLWALLRSARILMLLIEINAQPEHFDGENKHGA